MINYSFYDQLCTGDTLDIHLKLTEFQNQLSILLQLFRKGSSGEPAILLPDTEKHLMQVRLETKTTHQMVQM